jgi:SAM-dependent methyltransferase
MWHDVSELRQFYGSPLGHVAQRLIRRRLRLLWPDVTGQRVLALGYGTPYLRPFMEEAERVIALMPERQGVSPWPSGEPGLVGLCEEATLPLPDTSIDRILLIHALEHSEDLRRLLREVWRVLAGGGRLLLVVPNRRGLWARFERTPFGTGRPYSQPQLDRVLTDNLFLPIRNAPALYVPPSRRRTLLRLAPAWERLGERWARPFSGVLVSEVEKQVYVGTALRAEDQSRHPAASAAASGNWHRRVGTTRETGCAAPGKARRA